jgi:hypothetical protein
MQGDRPDGSFSAEELARLQAGGGVEIVLPGTPESEVSDRAMVERLDAVDADLIEREGPDALTSERLLRQAALSAERAPEYVGYAFAAWCRARGWERSDLADYLNVTVNQLAAMAITQRAEPWSPHPERRSSDDGVPRVDLAERFGANAGRLAVVLAG